MAGIPEADSAAISRAKVDSAFGYYLDHIEDLMGAFECLPEDPANKDWVKAKLSHMVALDQAGLKPKIDGLSRPEIEALKLEVYRCFEQTRDQNTADIKGLVARHGWFTISEFGEKADHNAWLLVQHADADPAFQQSVLKKLEPLAASGETSRSNYAYLYDRVQVNALKPGGMGLQRYGTQGTLSGGAWTPHPIEDPDNIDQRRAAMGLSPMSEYRKQVEQTYAQLGDKPEGASKKQVPPRPA